MTVQGQERTHPPIPSTPRRQNGRSVQQGVDHKELVWYPDCGSDLAEFTRDLAPGLAGILSDVDLAEQAECHNAVGVGGMRGKAPYHGIGLGREWPACPRR